MKLSFIDTIHRLRPRRFPVSREEEGVFKRVIVGNINSRRSVGDAYQHPPETTILSFSRVRKVRAQRGPCYVPDISFSFLFFCSRHHDVFLSFLPFIYLFSYFFFWIVDERKEYELQEMIDLFTWMMFTRGGEQFID